MAGASAQGAPAVAAEAEQPTQQTGTPAIGEVVALRAPDAEPQQAFPPPAPEAPEPPRAAAEVMQQEVRHPGRPLVDTTQISLRLPRRWEAVLRRRAAEASLETGRTVTPQQVILQLIGTTMPKSEGGSLDG